MRNTKVTVTEWYPVYTEDEDGTIELPDELARQLSDSTAAFQAVQREIREVLLARAEQRRADQHRAAVEAHRIARGPGRIRRRPRPNSTVTRSE